MTETTPTLYQDCKAMLAASTLVYPTNSLRIMARYGLTPKKTADLVKANEFGILTEPVKAKDMVQYIMDNHVMLGDAIFTTGVLGILTKICQDDYNAGFPDAELVVMSDQVNGEAVYVILLDKRNRRIIVSFRGTHDLQDTLQDVDIRNVQVPSPVNPKEKLTFHKGFYDYLFSPNFCQTGTKYEETMAHVKTLLAQNPECRLFVTGYSLGAALATHFAFGAAASMETKSPIICMPVASPLVGDYNFAVAFQQLEKAGKIRMLRIANNKDIVTYVPRVILSDNKALVKSADDTVPMMHVGFCLNMYRCQKLFGFVPFPFPVPFLTQRSSWMEFTYDKDPQPGVKELDLEKDLDRLFLMQWNHFPPEYLERVENLKDSFDKTTIEELYSDKELAGDLFSAPVLMDE